MRTIVQAVSRFIVSEDGPTAVEYAVMLALIVSVCLTAITSLGTNLPVELAGLVAITLAEETQELT